MSIHKNQIKENYFTNPDGLKLFEQIWLPECENIRAFVFIIHGLSEHSSFYYSDIVARPLNNIGCVVAGHDHVGHGKSDGNRRVVEKIDKLVRDVIVHIEHIRKKENIPDDVPTFLYGHSLGGLIACLISIERPELVKGMILEAPALTLNGRNDTGTFYMFAVRMLSLLMPSYVIRKPVFSNLTRNNEVIKCALLDEYRNKDGLTIGTAVNIGFAIDSIQSRLKDINTPFLVAHGKKDVVISSVGSQRLKDEASVKDKMFLEYEDAYHMLRIDSDEIYEDFQRKFVDWINEHI